MRSLIVGIDPGISTGVAILDLHGRLIHLSSRRDENKTKLARDILDHGSPMLVAMDVCQSSPSLALSKPISFSVRRTICGMLT